MIRLPHVVRGAGGGATGSTVLDTVGGSIGFADPDAGDVHTATVTGVVAGGITAGLPSSLTMLGWLAGTGVTERAAGRPGGLDWRFAAPDSAFDYLGAGQVLTLTYTVALSDGAGGVVTQPVVITVTGTAEAPVVTVPDAQISRTSGSTLVSGISVKAGDRVGATHTVTIADSIGTLGATASSGASISGSASKRLTISGSLDAVNATLATLTYLSASDGTDTVTVTDSDGAQASTASFTETSSAAANHAPVPAGPSVTTGTVTEQIGTAVNAYDTVSGMVGYQDVDLVDGHYMGLKGVTASGVVSGLPAAGIMQGWLRPGVVTRSTATGPGSEAWSFYAVDSYFDYLAAGETVTLAYQVTVNDAHGGVANQNVVITVIGTNDAPTILSGSVVTGAIASLGTSSGNDVYYAALYFLDPDASDRHVVSIGNIGVSGTVAGMSGVSTATMASWIQMETISEPQRIGSGCLPFSFNAPDSYFAYLSAGQSVKFTYNLLLADNHGGSATQAFTLTVNGTNRAPTAINHDFTTDNWTALTISAASLLAGAADTNLGDTLALSSVGNAVGGSVTLANGKALFTPNGAVGAGSFTYTISDGHGGTATATANVNKTLHAMTGTAGGSLTGGSAAAQLDGSAGNETVRAGAAGDILIGGPGDILYGGAGIDTFAFHPGFGQETLYAFNATGPSHDTLQVDKTLFADWAHLLGATRQQGSDLLVTLDAADTLLLKNVSLASFTSADAKFV